MKLDLHAYKEAVATFESNGKYHKRNDQKGREYGVSPKKWAWGKYQFTTQTLAGYGVSLMEKGRIVEERVQRFLGNHRLQESIMDRYTKAGIDRIKENETLFEKVQSGKKSLPELLAKGHIAGHGSMESNTVGKTDWLNTPVGSYAKQIKQTYHSIASTETPIIVADNTYNEAEFHDYEASPSVSPVIPSKVSVISKVAANDSIYSPDIKKAPKPPVLRVVQNEPRDPVIETPSVEPEITPVTTIEAPREAISVAMVENVAEKIAVANYRKKAIDTISNDSSIREEVKRSIIAKFEQMGDPIAFYEKNIAFFRSQ